VIFPARAVTKKVVVFLKELIDAGSTRRRFRATTWRAGTGVAVVKSFLGLVQSRHGRRQEFVDFCTHFALMFTY